MKLTVILPLFDEEALLPHLSALMRRIRSALETHEVEFLAVDDGSRDSTAAGLEGIEGLEVETHETNRGPGAAMNTGLARARGEAALVYDADESYPPQSLARLVESLAHADLATLSCYHPEGGVDGVGLLRRFLSRTASWLYRRRTKSHIFTFTCAVRAYRLPECRSLLPAPSDFTAAAYLLAKALALGLRVVEVPARLAVRRHGASKMKLLRTIRAHLRLLRDLPMTPKKSKQHP